MIPDSAIKSYRGVIAFCSKLCFLNVLSCCAWFEVESIREATFGLATRCCESDGKLEICARYCCCFICYSYTRCAGSNCTNQRCSFPSLFNALWRSGVFLGIVFHHQFELYLISVDSAKCSFTSLIASSVAFFGLSIDCCCSSYRSDSTTS